MINRFNSLCRLRCQISARAADYIKHAMSQQCPSQFKGKLNIGRWLVLLIVALTCDQVQASPVNVGVATYLEAHERVSFVYQRASVDASTGHTASQCIVVRIKNVSKTKILKPETHDFTYNQYSGAGGFLARIRSIKDDYGNDFNVKSVEPKLTKDDDGINPGETKEIRICFSGKLISTANYLKLQAPEDVFGNTKWFEVTIPLRTGVTGSIRYREQILATAKVSSTQAATPVPAPVSIGKVSAASPAIAPLPSSSSATMPAPIASISTRGTSGGGARSPVPVMAGGGSTWSGLSMAVAPTVPRPSASDGSRISAAPAPSRAGSGASSFDQRNSLSSIKPEDFSTNSGDTYRDSDIEVKIKMEFSQNDSSPEERRHRLLVSAKNMTETKILKTNARSISMVTDEYGNSYETNGLKQVADEMKSFDSKIYPGEIRKWSASIPERLLPNAKLLAVQLIPDEFSGNSRDRRPYTFTLSITEAVPQLVFAPLKLTVCSSGESTLHSFDATNTGTAYGVDFGSYLKDLQRRIKRAWFPPRLNKPISTVTSFKIHSNGTLSNLRLVGSSGLGTPDQAALRAVQNASPFRPLPDGSPEAIDVNLNFVYEAPSAVFRRF